jgi:hypothetical protein
MHIFYPVYAYILDLVLLSETQLGDCQKWCMLTHALINLCLLLHRVFLKAVTMKVINPFCSSACVCFNRMAFTLFT